MASKWLGIFFFIQIFVLTINHSYAFPKPAGTDGETIYNRELSDERPLQEQIAEADRINKAGSLENNQESEPAEAEMDRDNDDFSMLKSLAERSKDSNNETPNAETLDIQYLPDDADSTKNRRLAEDYDSTKNGMDYRYQDDPDSFHQLDGTPLTAEDIVQKIATKIYEEDDRRVFDRIVSKLLKLGLITDSQADTLEYEVAEALQDLISKNAKNNEIKDLSMDYPISKMDDIEQNPDMNLEVSEKERKKYEEEEGAEDGDDMGDSLSEVERQNDLSADEEMEELEYFPNFYNLLKSLDSEQDAEERETLITIMKTLIDFVKMMVKYGTITPEEGVSYLENLDAMIAIQTKNKLGKTLTPDSQPPTEKVTDEEDNTKEEAAKMQREYESQTDSTKDDQTVTEPAHTGKSETYLEAIRKNIEWLKTHNKDGNNGDYDISKLRDFMDQQVDSYIEKGILEKDEGEIIKRIYGSL
ncbi:secretogranin-3-like isoform X2 [Conger conger]|uniref:secretogranin-3-like isoform X2 n=1 Tax=Conger conger TaxID=82655 RepID=UPI002A598822|nr:secretogranin-3-like isoform X2 [Conger conger]